MKRLIGICKIRKSALALLLLTAFCIFGDVPQAVAHGGEDHGDSKPKTTSGEKGTVSHTARLGNFEVMVKHALIEPDKAAAARLFITNFQTNAPADKVSPAAEIESASGSVTPIMVEKTDSAGSYNLKIPALPAGVYTLRAKVIYSGETDTATFSSVRVETAPAASAESVASWGRTVLIVLFGVFVLGLFGGLIYFAVRVARGGQAREEAVSI